MFDRYRLEYEMKKRGITLSQLCEHLGISKSAYRRKSYGITEWTLKEINGVTEFLEQDSPMDIFFADEVS